MTREEFMKLYNKINSVQYPEDLRNIISMLENAGYKALGEDCYDVNPETVESEEYGNFLLRYAEQMMFYKFTA